MAGMAHHPFFNPEKRKHQDGAFAREEVRLAGRNHGMHLEALRYDVTPAGMHYLLIHFDVPHVADADRWTLSIGGEVERPFSIRLTDIRSAQQVTRRVTLECAGNGRAVQSPRWQSQPWHHEAVGTAEWTGTPLKPLLERAGLRPHAKDVVFYGTDRGFDSGVEHDYGRALSPAIAMSDDILLVTAMNGQPLLPQHGFPLRLIVPGWYGMASVKWLNRIEVIDHAFQGHQQVGTYVYREKAGAPGTPVTTMRVKSLMLPPGIPDWYSRARLVDAGAVELMGRAWSGNGVGIRRVEVAVDGQWREAELDAPQDRYAWRGWRCMWQASPGERVLQCRATDDNGDIQPVEQRFDNAGFGNNQVQSVAVTVRARP
ncbi:MAG: Sulfoxide reductase catalytic subunit YedY [Pseudomonadota bacterium]